MTTLPEQDRAPADVAAAGAVWETLARTDPLWAVLSDPDKRGRQWSVAQFLTTGEAQVVSTLARFHELGGTFADRRLAVDFGCGVGRLTQPLGGRFESALGIDISPTMVAIAERLNRQPASVAYRVNDGVDLSFLETKSVSLVLSHIVLQHIPPPASIAYIREFLRIVEPGGGVIFQLPSHHSDVYLPHDRDDRPVAESARRARVLARSVPHELAPDAEAVALVEVTNLSRVEWVQSDVYTLNVGNHWLGRETGRMVRYDDGRRRLPGRIRGGDTVALRIPLRAPSRPGAYRLQFDVVQEGLCWFGAEEGGEVCVSVVAPAPLPGLSATERGPLPVPASGYEGGTFDDLLNPDPSGGPAFEMHGVPRSQVEALITRAGARLLGADEWVDEWHSFTYYVQMPA